MDTKRAYLYNISFQYNYESPLKLLGMSVKRVTN